jgi:hypothetical protein
MVSATSGMRETSALMSTMAVITECLLRWLRAGVESPVAKPSGGPLTSSGVPNAS